MIFGSSLLTGQYFSRTGSGWIRALVGFTVIDDQCIATLMHEGLILFNSLFKGNQLHDLLCIFVCTFEKN